MADGCHLENRHKLPYFSNSLTDYHKIWHDDAFLTLSTLLAIKISNY